MISVLAARSPGSSFHLALGDMPTWLLAVFAALAFVAAVRAYREQVKASKALADQLKVQQLALEDQRTASSTLAEQAQVQRQALADQQAASPAVIAAVIRAGQPVFPRFGTPQGLP